MIDRAAADKLLTTTRSVRKRLDFDRPVPPELIEECIDIALQSPTGSNRQNWAFVVVTDPGKKLALADLYRKAGEAMAGMLTPPEYAEGDPRKAAHVRVYDSAIWLTERLEQVPVFVIPCVEGRVEKIPSVVAQASTYGSILPAAWSFMLAARARGLGSVWTTIHLLYEQEANALLAVPDTFTQAALLPVAFYKGDDFKPGSRLPAREVTYWDTWGARLGG
jgi:nitroreductase